MYCHLVDSTGWSLRPAPPYSSTRPLLANKETTGLATRVAPRLVLATVPTVSEASVSQGRETTADDHVVHMEETPVSIATHSSLNSTKRPLGSTLLSSFFNIGPAHSANSNSGRCKKL